MLNPDELCVICAPRSLAVTVGRGDVCSTCGALVWVSETSQASIAKQNLPVRIVCYNCVKPEEIAQAEGPSEEQLKELLKHGIPPGILNDFRNPEKFKKMATEYYRAIQHGLWCKERALKQPTVELMAASLISDLSKHPSTRLEAMFATATLPLFKTWPIEKMRDFITKLKL